MNRSMDTPTHREIRAWLEREIALGLEAVPRTTAVVAPSEARGFVQKSEVGPGVAAAKSETPAAERVAEPAHVAVATAGPSSARRPSSFQGAGPLSDLVDPEVRAADSLAAVREVLGDCRRCKLCKGRTNIVFGVGNPDARLMFVGEGPGEDEDLKGEPFVGKAGSLLTDIITKGMGLRRSDVYIANVVKCRPPNNRDPEPDEIVACEPFLKRQVALVNPEVIVSLGKFATQALLGDRTPISRRRGTWHEYEGRPLMPTFHPAYLLRNPSDKGLVWADIKLVMERLGLPLPPARGGRA
jgi:uracil-DNA glycosylase family 4